MTKKSCGYCPHPKRALLKVAGLLVVLAALVWGALVAFDDSIIDQMKFDLSLGALILVVVVVNAVSLLFFVAVYMAYQWVRRDLKAPRSEDSPSDLGDDD